jgi:Holliday junction resolvase-like predicted endonuclease
VEVKTRLLAAESPFTPFDAIDRRKQRQLTMLARRYQAKYRSQLKRWRLWNVRFDAVGISATTMFGLLRPRVSHVMDYFRPVTKEFLSSSPSTASKLRCGP